MAKGERFNTFRDRFHNVERNDGIDGESKLIPLSTELRLIRRHDNKLVIVGRFDETDEIGELFSIRMEKKILGEILYCSIIKTNIFFSAFFTLNFSFVVRPVGGKRHHGYDN